MDSELSLLDLVRCESCEIPDPSLRCEVCNVKLCKACGGEHVLDESKTHNIVVIVRPKFTTCLKHVNEQCVSYCEQCKLSLCTLCLPLEEHRGHIVVDIFEIVEQKRDILQRDLNELEQIILPKFQSIVTEIPTQKVAIESKIENIIATICNRGQEMHKQIDLIMNKMKRDVTERGSKQLSALYEIDKDIKQRILEIESIILDIKRVQKSNDVSVIFAHKSRNSEFRRYSPKTAQSITKFSAPNITRKRLQIIFGSLSEITQEQHDITISVPEGESSEVKSLLNEFKISTSITTNYGGYMKELLSITCLNDDEIWTCGNSTSLFLYNLLGEIKESFKTVSGNMPRDLAVTRSGYLVYTDFKAKNLTILKKNARNPSKHAIRFGKWKPRNVCSTSSDDLLISMESDDQKQTKIVRLAGSNYTKSKEIQFDDKGRPLFSDGGYDKALAENRNLDICIADFGAGELVVLDQNGKLRFRYTGSTLILDHKKSFHPRGVTTDSQCQILTSDHYNHSIHILDKNGQFLCHIGNCVQRPWGLCVDSRDNLFVAEFFSGKVKKIQYYRESNTENKELSLTMCCIS